jgi:transposase
MMMMLEAPASNIIGIAKMCQRLVAKGKQKKVALTAAKRKLRTIPNTPV